MDNHNRLLSGEILKLLPPKKLSAQILLASHVKARHMLETTEKYVLYSVADKVNEIHLIASIHVFNRVNTFDKLQPTDGECGRRNMIRSSDSFTFEVNSISVANDSSRWLINLIFLNKK
jgi:hypothetical protein